MEKYPSVEGPGRLLVLHLATKTETLLTWKKYLNSILLKSAKRAEILKLP